METIKSPSFFIDKIQQFAYLKSILSPTIYQKSRGSWRKGGSPRLRVEQLSGPDYSAASPVELRAGQIGGVWHPRRVLSRGNNVYRRKGEALYLLGRGQGEGSLYAQRKRHSYLFSSSHTTLYVFTTYPTHIGEHFLGLHASLCLEEKQPFGLPQMRQLMTPFNLAHII